MLITISELSSVESLCTTGPSCYPKVDHSYETFHKHKMHKAKKAITLEYILLMVNRINQDKAQIQTLNCS